MVETKEKVIAVRNLQKSYKGHKVLKNINFSVEKGSIFALLGSNGAGKTTTIKILSTLLNANSGSAVINGFNVMKEPEKVRGVISLTGQYAAVDEGLTGRENIRMIGKLRHLPKANKEADKLLDRVQLLDAADKHVSTYSGGMRRRLDLAMSLLGNPSVIFLDEPTTGLDPQSRLSLWQMIKELAEAGTTVFLTTQYLEEADHLADYIAILNQGEIVAEGTSQDLKKLLPEGHIELGFNQEREVRAAFDVLHDFHPTIHPENRKLVITTDGSIKQMTNMLNRLEQAGISVSQLTQKQPTLEDVFLTIIGEKEGA
ncbi:daunorubicin resistance protein DrrA family ABC transporter ATP-binding protein [Gracilibacillus lacisalsi]|uniref:daunorubicin resistance protein DrrA family ABC transporter ATP-binding protein n=1 Tax=Gracilibacillus lacisalsi TaxID=393087 RepID=UPI00037B3197|nr:daunorubicin resistance protein DrrA family ABC transporter ATP-binding protein [Gracilibacillus lacisalsi]